MTAIFSVCCTKSMTVLVSGFIDSYYEEIVKLVKVSKIVVKIFIRIEDDRLGLYFIYFPFIFSYFLLKSRK